MGGRHTHQTCPQCGRMVRWGALFQHVRAAHGVEPEILNRRDFAGGALPPHSTYCGRGTPFGNPYRIGPDGSRDEVIDRYIAERSQDEAFLALVRRQLKGRHLVCHCAPERCHCEWLREVANS
jgi:hypothetical protein